MTPRVELALIVVVFLAAWFLPVDLLPQGGPRLQEAGVEALAMLHEYAREHVLLCLVPAFFIAGAISVFVRQASVMKYLGASASKWVAYPVAAISGTLLAVCSCTVLPLFTGIHRRGAGLGPASAFLYSGPAINVLAIILTARVLGFEIGVARAVGAIAFSVLVGLSMHLLFLGEERARVKAALAIPPDEEPKRKLWQDGLYFASMVAFLVFANWGRPAEGDGGLWAAIFELRGPISGASLAALALMIWRWFDRDELRDWLDATLTFALLILPLLFAGVVAAGFLLGRPGHEGVIPSAWVAALVGGNSVWANLFASVVAAFMYFATLTEVPILQGLIGSGMGEGPALTLLLAGPALSLPSMIVIRSVLGTRKTVAFIVLVVLFSTLAGLAYGALA
ncbi:MAG: permease [Deltaproteobacteria bacterium]|nr:permease [Deltaproteobacteria bacterium]